MRESITEVRELESADSVRIWWKRNLGNQQNAAHGSMAGDAGAADDVELLAAQFDAGNDADIGAAVREPVGALGGNGKTQIEQVALLAVQHAPDQRDGVQIADGTDARLQYRVQLTVYQAKVFSLFFEGFAELFQLFRLLVDEVLGQTLEGGNVGGASVIKGRARGRKRGLKSVIVRQDLAHLVVHRAADPIKDHTEDRFCPAGDTPVLGGTVRDAIVRASRAQ